MPFFSVIIPVHNRPILVRQAIDSVLAQTFTEREIIVVDDASTDNTPEVLRSFGSEIRVVTLAESGGCEVARNAGGAVARGRYLAFLDSDDLLFPWALDTYHFIIAKTQEPALLVSRFDSFAGERPALASSTPGDTVEVVVFSDYLARDRNIPSTASMIVVRQDVYSNVGGWRQSTTTTFNGSDHDFLLRVGCHGPAVLLERPCTVAYRLHPSNSIRDLRRVVEGIIRLIEAERHDAYPGGRQRRLDRRAMLGNQTYWWSRCAFLQWQPWLAIRLLFAGCDMLWARVVKKLRTRGRASIPTTRLQRNAPVNPSW
ncbi:MAG: glycosyltransferase [Verrucomicrobia bacterium]|nr:glycosyltransferase [Verrucomicrobiota bacterium]